MFPRNNSLSDSLTIKKVLRSGKKHSLSSFIAYYLPNTLTQKFQICIIITKKSVPKATLRNSLKRRFNHTLKDLLKTKPAISLVVIIKPQLVLSTHTNFKSEITKLILSLNEKPSNNLN